MKNLVDSNYTIFRLKSFDKKKVSLNPENEAKIETLKKTAPKIYERLLKLQFANRIISEKDVQYVELKAFGQRQLEQAQNEWDYVVHMSEMVTYSPKVNADKERKQLSEKAKVKGTDKHTELDQTYKDELKENLKPKEINFETDLKNYERRPFINDEEEQRNYLYSRQMKMIKDYDGSATVEKVQQLVGEYMKRLLDKAALRFRVSSDAAISILNSRYHSSKSKNLEKYKEFMELNFSKNTKLKTHEAFAFGILGGNTAKEFSGFGSTDACKQYGKVSIKLKKDKMKGRTTFVCGNSMGHTQNYVGMLGFDFYCVKKARDAFPENGKPDLSGCGDNLYDMYRRAKKLSENDWKDLKSPEQEALEVITDKDFQKYFEAQFHGQVGASEMEELTMVMSKKGKSNEMWDFSNIKDLENIKNDPEVRKIYDAVNIVNKNPAEYGRTAEDGELKLTLWDCRGNTVTFDDLKFIMEK